MLVYRDHEEVVDGRDFLRGCRAAARGLERPVGDAGEAATSLLVDVGMLEAALVDRLWPVADGLGPATDALRRAGMAAGRLFLAPGPAAARALGAALDAIARLAPAGPLSLRTPEGYAWYALHPEGYAAAARAFARALAPGRVVCVVGLRSIGASLAAAAAAALEAAGVATESLTLRPRGHPFDRRPVVTPELAARLAARAADGARFLVVDEGPGLSGSSFAGTAELLEELGAPGERVAFLPGHRPDPAALNNARARDRWRRHAAWPAGHGPGPDAAPRAGRGADLSGGAWRARLYAGEADWPAVRPGTERRKVLVEEPGLPPALHRFAGLGRFGRRARDRAAALAGAGFAAPPLGLRRGYLAQPFVPGRPSRPGEADAGLIAFATAYLGHLAREHGTGRAARPEALAPLIRVNAAEALGSAAVPDADRLERHARGLPAAPEIALDARVMAHEWLRTPGGGFLKADALDHHADHFHPGPADAAWDVAGLMVELALPDAARAELAADMARSLGDPALPARLPFHLAAYCAARVGWAAGGGVEGAERLRLAAAGRRYRRELARSLERLAAAIG